MDIAERYDLQSRKRTHTVLVIGLYELLGNPTNYLIEPPGPWLLLKRTSNTTACYIGMV
jgi:hypothetical protein